VNLRLHDTATRSIRAFVPMRPGRVGMYQCGATVQSSPHIGHLRSGLVFDLLRRWLIASGYEVTLVRNVTDIDDKILNRAVAEERPWWVVATHYEREFQWAYDQLGCVRPTIEPRATGHITQMVELIERLLANGVAYAADGDVYFAVDRYPSYGSLSGQRPDELKAAGDVVGPGKRDPRDFALWKGAREGEPSWPASFGRGRPGWHIECSAMACTYLGPEFDIHGGGLDLVFPHHENEIAQSRAAGDPFARLWFHNAWVTTAGEKMSKSLGNSLSIASILQRVRPVELRWYLLSGHYRSNLEYSASALDEAATGYRRIEQFVRRGSEAAGSRTPEADRVAANLPARFREAMDDDLSVPRALATLHAEVHGGNRALDSSDHESVGRAVAAVRSMLDVLGVDPLASPWSEGDVGSVERDALRRLVEAELAARQQARGGRDFAMADSIRTRLSEAGIQVEDGASGSVWSLSADRPVD